MVQWRLPPSFWRGSRTFRSYSIFVLSGFVLSLSFMAGQKTLPFYVRRLWRIYPALWAASALALLYVTFLHRSLPEQSDWFRQYFHSSMFDAKHVVASFLALDLFLITPAWTIFVELVASVAMPLIAFITRRAWLAFAAIASTVALAFIYPGKFYVGIYLVCFVVGGAVAAWRNHGPLGWVLRRRVLARLLPVAALLVALAFRWTGHWGFHAVLPTLVETIAAALSVHLLASPERPMSLETPALTAVGDVSYSLYILHFPIMCVAGLWIGGLAMPVNLAALMLACLTAASTFVLAVSSYRYVERGGIRIGGQMARLLVPRALR
jgi:peptidoglycan/LPS O-acetylase OafA/YrhL